MPNLSPLKFGAYHMIGQDAWEPQRTNNFELRFPNLPQLYSIDTGIAMPANSSEYLTLSLKSADTVNININSINISYGNNTVKFAGKPEYGDFSATFRDFIGLQTERILTSWSKLVYNPATEKVGRASVYKQQAYLLEFAPDGTQLKTWKLEGCWPGTMNFGSYSNDDNSVREITVTFYADVAIPLD
jgi:hypothetical protein